MASTGYVSIWPTDPRLFESIFEASPSALLALDSEGRIVASNSAAGRLFGYKPADLVQRRFSELSQHPVQSFLIEALGAARNGGSRSTEIELAHVSSTPIPAQLVTIPVAEGSHSARLILRVDDLTERHRIKTQLRALAYYDSLTGLPNRILFLDRLRDAIEHITGQSRCAAILLLDLDRFKDLNETLGHAMGDRFLQLIAERLATVVKDRGMVARFAGDEFAVLVPDCSGREEIEKLAEELRNGIDQAYRIEGFEQYITTSIGVVIYPEHGRDEQTLIKNADIALYYAKQQGRNAYFFYDEAMEAPIRNRLAQEKHLRNALARGEFLLQYQPIMQMRDHNRIFGVEALVRWQHPKDGLLLPDTFIPAAEASGLIIPLGEWIERTAIERVRAWQNRFGFFTLAINISAREFYQRDLCERLISIAKTAGLAPQAIAVEITESMALFDAEHAIETIRALKKAGTQIAIDDFGTGHSSLHYLRRIEIDHIKIDRSFVSGIGVRSSDETIVKAIVAMGHSLGLKIIAEGVESQEQYDFLDAQGCDLVQGNLLAAPMDPKPMEALLAERQAC